MATKIEILGGRDVPVGGTYTCPDCMRKYTDVEKNEILKPCPSDDCPQYHELKGKVHPANFQNDDYILPIGKEHKGKRLIDVPVKYLDWLINQEWLYPETKKKITDHLETSRKPEWEAISR